MRRGVQQIHAGTLTLISADVKQVASAGEVGDMAFITNNPRCADGTLSHVPLHPLTVVFLFD